VPSIGGEAPNPVASTVNDRQSSCPERHALTDPSPRSGPSFSSRSIARGIPSWTDRRSRPARTASRELVTELDPERNGALDPATVAARSDRRLW
jgi:hypothetical protein